MHWEQHLSVRYDDIFGSMDEQREAVKVQSRLLEIMDQPLAERLLVGQNTGPNPTVTPSVNVGFAK